LAWDAITGADGSSLKSPHARSFYNSVTWQHVLGWPPHRPAPTNYAVFLRYKLAHPEKIIALRLNQRQPFSVIGVDAVITTELLEVKGDQLAGKCDSVPVLLPG
jgi:hypothetical protein